MTKLLLPAALMLSLAACGTGLIPPITRDISDINLTLPSAAQSSMIIYLSANQFADLPDAVKSTNSVSIAGKLLYTGTGSLSSIGLYLRQDTVGCTNQGTYLVCSGDQAAFKIKDLNFGKGTPTAITIEGPVLNKAVQQKSGYLGFQINSGVAVQGDKLAITEAKATIRF